MSAREFHTAVVDMEYRSWLFGAAVIALRSHLPLGAVAVHTVRGRRPRGPHGPRRVGRSCVAPKARRL